MGLWLELTNSDEAHGSPLHRGTGGNSPSKLTAFGPPPLTVCLLFYNHSNRKSTIFCAFERSFPILELLAGPLSQAHKTSKMQSKDQGEKTFTCVCTHVVLALLHVLPAWWGEMAGQPGLWRNAVPVGHGDGIWPGSGAPEKEICPSWTISREEMHSHGKW